MSYPRWVENIVDVCMAIQPGEKVLLITDEPMDIMRKLLVYTGLLVALVSLLTLASVLLV